MTDFINQLRAELDQLKFAILYPQLHLNHIFEDLKNEIDIQTQIALLNNECNRKKTLCEQECMLKQVTEYEEFCTSNISQPLGTSLCDLSSMDSNIDNVESLISETKNKSTNLEEISECLSNAILKFEKQIFKNNSIHFVGAGEANNLSLLVKSKDLLGVLIIIDDDYITNKAFSKE